MKYFEIGDDYASIFEEDGSVAFDGDVKLQVPSVKFVEAYFGRDFGVLPPAVRWISDTTPTSILFERPPEARVLTIKDEDYKVNLPWMLYLITYKDLSTVTMRTFCRPSPLSTMDDEIFTIPLPTRNEDGLLEGFEFTFKKLLGSSLHECVQKAFEFMDNKEINLDFVPASWGKFNNTEDVLTHWTDLTVAELLSNTEWRPSPVHSISHLVAGANEDEAPESAFEYLNSIIKSVATDIKVL